MDIWTDVILPVIWPVVASFMAIIGGVLVWLLNRVINAKDKKDETRDKRLDGHDHEIKNLQISVTTNAAVNEQRFDNLVSDISEIKVDLKSIVAHQIKSNDLVEIKNNLKTLVEQLGKKKR